jgi:hypothetical protein
MSPLYNSQLVVEASDRDIEKRVPQERVKETKMQNVLLVRRPTVARSRRSCLKVPVPQESSAARKKVALGLATHITQLTLDTGN